jgi:hypothetical protein
MTMLKDLMVNLLLAAISGSMVYLIAMLIVQTFVWK